MHPVAALLALDNKHFSLADIWPVADILQTIDRPGLREREAAP
jgi:hypothetical protein